MKLFEAAVNLKNKTVLFIKTLCYEIPMKTNACVVCQKTKSLNACGACGDTVCKSCAQFVDEDTFKYQAHKPASVQHSLYCPVCFDQHVAEAIHHYEDTLNKAYEIAVFEISQSKETRLIKRLEKTIRLENETDRNDAIMKLAFIAAEKNFNSIIDVDIVGKKVRDGSYQTTSYTCSAVPVNVSDRKLLKDRSLKSYPN